MRGACDRWGPRRSPERPPRSGVGAAGLGLRLRAWPKSRSARSVHSRQAERRAAPTQKSPIASAETLHLLRDLWPMIPSTSGTGPIAALEASPLRAAPGESCTARKFAAWQLICRDGRSGARWWSTRAVRAWFVTGLRCRRRRRRVPERASSCHRAPRGPGGDARLDGCAPSSAVPGTKTSPCPARRQAPRRTSRSTRGFGPRQAGLRSAPVVDGVFGPGWSAGEACVGLAIGGVFAAARSGRQDPELELQASDRRLPAGERERRQDGTRPRPSQRARVDCTWCTIA